MKYYGIYDFRNAKIEVGYSPVFYWKRRSFIAVSTIGDNTNNLKDILLARIDFNNADIRSARWKTKLIILE